MKIRVQNENGSIETIEFDDSAEVQTGKELDRLITSGVEHFFTKDGFYDGWGRGVSCSAPDANALVAQKRDVEPRTSPTPRRSKPN